MRPSCLYCARKHLGQAEVLMAEAINGYPLHKWIAVGHMAEAEHELLNFSKELADDIRKHRLEYMVNDNYFFPTLDIIQKINNLEPSHEKYLEDSKIANKIDELYNNDELPTDLQVDTQFTDEK